MSQARRRWLISIVLILGVIAFVGFSMIPLFEDVFRKSQPSTVATPNASQTILAEQKSNLVEQAKGYEIVLQQEPDNQTALQGLAQARIELGDLQGAVTPLEKLISLYPAQAEYHLVLGQVYAQQKNYDQAIAAYDRAIETDRQDFRPVLSKAVALQQQGKTEEAKSTFEQAATLAPPQYKDQINQLAKPPTVQQPPAKTAK